MKLIDLIAELPETLQRELAGVPVQPQLHPRDAYVSLGRIEERITSSAYLNAVLANLTPIEKEVLRDVLSEGGEVLLSDLESRMARLGAREVAAAIDALRRRGLLFSPRLARQKIGAEVLFLPPQSFSLCHARVPAEPRLGLCLLKGIDRRSLEQLTARAGCAVRQDLALSHVLAFRAHLRDEARLRAAMASLSAEELRALHRVMDSGGQMQHEELVAAFVPKAMRPQYWTRPWPPAQGLQERGLLFVLGLYHPALAAVPADERPRVERVLLEAKQAALSEAITKGSLERAPTRTVTNEGNLLRDLRAFLAATAAGQVRATQAGQVLRADVKRLQGAFALLREDAFYADFVAALALQLGIAGTTESADERRVVVSGEGQEFFEKGFAAMERTFRLWLVGRFWNEGSPRRLLEGETDKEVLIAANRVPVVKAREALLRALSRCPVDRWIRLSGLQAIARELGYFGLFESADPSEPVPVPPAELLRRIVAEGLLWTGVVRVEEGADDPGVALTPTGAALLGVASAPPGDACPSEEWIVVQASLEVIAPAASFEVARELFSFAEPAGEGKFRLTKDCVRGYLDRGRTPEEMLAFLDAHARGGVPDVVRRLVTDVAERYGHVRVGEAEAYVSVHDPHLLEEILASRKLSPLIERRVGPTVALVKRKNLDALVKALRAQGYFPAVEGQAS